MDTQFVVKPGKHHKYYTVPLNKIIDLLQFNKDLEGDVQFSAEAGVFSIPIRCTIKKCDVREHLNFCLSYHQYIFHNPDVPFSFFFIFVFANTNFFSPPTSWRLTAGSLTLVHTWWARPHHGPSLWLTRVHWPPFSAWIRPRPPLQKNVRPSWNRRSEPVFGRSADWFLWCLSWIDVCTLVQDVASDSQASSVPTVLGEFQLKRRYEELSEASLQKQSGKTFKKTVLLRTSKTESTYKHSLGFTLPSQLETWRHLLRSEGFISALSTFHHWCLDKLSSLLLMLHQL